MKIQDLIPLEKHLKLITNWENTTKRRFLQKNGHYWDIPSHSADEGVLLNNYEKDCVIAYVKNIYLTIFLIKIRGHYRGFIHSKEFLKNTFSGYSMFDINSVGVKNIINAFKNDEENLVVADKKEYGKFSKFLLLEALEN